MKKLAIAIMLGLGVMVSGCSHNDVPTVQQTQQQTIKDLDAQNGIDNPNVIVGDKFYLNGQPNQEFANKVNNRVFINRVYGGNNGVTHYFVDVTEAQKDTEKKNYVCVVDSVMITTQDAQYLKLGGLYTGTDEKVKVTTIYAHIKEVK